MIETPKISADDCRLLLVHARSAAREFLGKRVEGSKLEVHGEFGGAFVTFWSGKRLRGCVGSFQPTTDIARTITDVTRSSLQDSRFVLVPVSMDDMQTLTIEVSILSTLEQVEDPLSLVPGEDGVVIRSGGQSGCFLPQVAKERGWSIQQLLSNCCTMKAGLDADAWRQPTTTVERFRAIVFSEA